MIHRVSNLTKKTLLHLVSPISEALEVFGNTEWPQDAATFGTHPISKHSAFFVSLLINLHGC